jgi:uncharacterized protein YneF (UPF0154 family)
MKVRLHPVLTLLSILFISLTLGLLGSWFFYHRDEQQFLEEYRRTGLGTPAEFGDSGLLYLLIGIGLGLLVGLVIGISAYVFIKQRQQEGQHSILNW